MSDMGGTRPTDVPASFCVELVRAGGLGGSTVSVSESSVSESVEERDSLVASGDDSHALIGGRGLSLRFTLFAGSSTAMGGSGESGFAATGAVDAAGDGNEAESGDFGESIVLTFEKKSPNRAGLGIGD